MVFVYYLYLLKIYQFSKLNIDLSVTVFLLQ